MKPYIPFLKAWRIPIGIAMAFITTIMAATRVPANLYISLASTAPEARSDKADLLSPAAVHIDGWLGARIADNESKRLLVVDTVPLLAGYHKRPGSHPWIGEHIGKWMHAATLAWAYTGDPRLKEKLDGAAAELVSCQEADGYLGTYLPKQRFGLFPEADWDVWSHKYNLMGLLTYYQYTGNKAALEACRKMGDLLIATFPKKRSILAAGTHMGMAATSVLEPVMLLYKATGDDRYLNFARYIVRSWDEPGGPKIAATLLSLKRVDKTANGKAYEMLSNLVGLCEFARATGDEKLLQAVTNAWQDIVKNRLYLTGSASCFEHFRGDHDLPNTANNNIGETCVTTTWIQFNLQLLRLTGEAKYGDELERTIYNHLAAAQNPRGDDWCYYTALEGRKPYDKGINCCHSSGPRGMALAPQAAYLLGKGRSGDMLLVDTLETSRATLDISRGKVTVQQTSDFPHAGRSTIALRPTNAGPFGIRIRIPAWATPAEVHAGDATYKSDAAGWLVVPSRKWESENQITITFHLGSRLIQGDHGNAGRAALAWGPFVLAYDESLNPGLPAAKSLGLVDSQPRLTLQPGRKLAFSVKLVGRTGTDLKTAVFVPFADAGAEGGEYRIWMRAPGVAASQAASLLGDGEESRSRQGNMSGSILGDDLQSPVVTFNGRPAREDWYAVSLSVPVIFRRVVFAHGKTFHDGGWFNGSQGKPRVQIQRQKGGPWVTIGELVDYPSTSSTDSRGLQAGQQFTLHLPNPIEAFGVRVVGKPASGDNPSQAFSSCAELAAFAR
jgi:uncharacterized protein